MKILAIDTSCDETAAAVTEGTQVLSNVIWSQASLHAKWGGIVPSLAQRAHKERIGFVLEKAMTKSQIPMTKIDAVAVTVGPGLAIALEVGIERAKQLARKWHKPLITVNHVEGHILSPLARAISKPHPPTGGPNPNFPCLGLVVSGGHTEVILVEEIGKYKIIARTIDDALGEALDKAARMLGLGYPGGPVLEKMAKLGDPKAYPLPLPMAGREERYQFSYSGLKTALYRRVNSLGLGKQTIYDLAASFQAVAFAHLLRITERVLREYPVEDFLVGGGVAANIELRGRLRQLGRRLGLRVHFPYSKKLCTDNAAMIGVAASFKAQRGEFVKDSESLDRDPRARINE